jgi:UDP-N-acetylglucosamine 2-epimerase (non-hydrolysing)
LQLKKIDIIVGARPNFIKAFPVYDSLQNSGNYKVRLINTGQHYDKNMADIFFLQLNMTKPDVNLMVGSGSHAEQTAKIMVEIEKVFIKNKPDLVIVFGDVNSTIAAALSASKLHIPVAHVEAGLRSFDRTMPEEINRVLTDQISDLLFITSPEAKDNLTNEGKEENQIFFVGNTMIDSLIRFEEHFNGQSILTENNIQKGQFVLVTIHRPSNVDNPTQFYELINMLNKIANKYHVIWPIHPRTKKIIDENNISLNNKIITMPPVGYLEFMGLQKSAKFIITDSGGVQEESTYFGVPCFTVRENTERPITITEGSNKLAGTDFKLVLDLINNALLSTKRISLKPKYWDGKASDRIALIFDKYFEKIN